MLKVLLIGLSLLLIACQRSRFISTPTQSEVQCSSSEIGNTIYVNCPNGIAYSFPAAQNGVDGLNGQDGVNGINGTNGTNGLNAQGIRIVDPCGDDAGRPDEVLLIFPDNSVLAWYQSLGLSVLQPNVVYTTTDFQRCLFKVDVNGNVIHL